MSKSDLHIVYVDESTCIGGAEVYLRILAGTFGKEIRVSLVHHDDDIHRSFYSEIPSEVARICLPRPLTRSGYWKRYLRIFHDCRPEIVHLNQPAPDYCRIAAIAARMCGVPTVIATSHLPNLHFRRSVAGTMLGKAIWDWIIWRTLFASLNTVIVVSNASRDSLLKHYPVRPERVECIHNGIAVERFTGDIGDAVRLRRELGISPNQKVLTSIGTLARQKGQDILLKAFQIMSTDPESVLVLVGDGPMRSTLESTAKQMGLADRVRFTGARQDIPKLLSITTVYINSSRWEGLPFTVLEAMAASVPVIATAVDGNVEVIDDGVNGLLVNPDDPARLASAARRILHDKALCERLGSNGATTVRQQFSLEAMLMRTRALYIRSFGHGYYEQDRYTKITTRKTGTCCQPDSFSRSQTSWK